MILETTAAYIATIGSDHTITLPKEMPIGAKVAVVLVPQNAVLSEEARHARFAATLAAIKEASLQPPRPPLSGEEFDKLIEEARKATVA